ncbi:hypothetical protein CHO01_38800 [Cellulomonas hominis]|uniref:Uncharacterized protein n=1 Tax=Cellulomonas hominis TaxID=156981 RepID=A0A511FJL3_9CELL|nr:hypothetical protein [Cellulomonas hominis]MBB5474649.1 hypothetical protein [Cellulomonas hominis]NKY06611.1 hypothetical protein [Cellulomonas hominis]GEL48764.1 hypothetical protein CHO01_38800 [Cellulomonas hominis]
MSTQARTPAGVTEGGQFAATVRSESTVDLRPDTYMMHAGALGARLAAAVGVSEVSELTVGTGVACGAPDGSRYVSVRVDVPGSTIGEQVRTAGT